MDKIASLEKYLKFYKNVVIVDPIDSLRKVLSRSRTCLSLEQIIKKTPQCPFNQPQFAVVDNANTIVSSMKERCIKYPVICKPLEACGTPNSHSMVRIKIIYIFEKLNIYIFIYNYHLTLK